MSTKMLVILLAVATMGIMCLPASAWVCYNYVSYSHYINATDTPAQAWTDCWGCAHEHHWVCYWDPPSGYNCSGTPTAKGNGMAGSWWGDNRHFSPQKYSGFGYCLDGGWPSCTRCEDHTSSCSYIDLVAYCCL